MRSNGIWISTLLDVCQVKLDQQFLPIYLAMLILVLCAVIPYLPVGKLTSPLVAALGIVNLIRFLLSAKNKNNNTL